MHLFLSHLCCVPSVKGRAPCMCRLLELMTDISYLHMTASCQSLPSHLHMTASCQSLTSQPTRLHHVHHFTSAHGCLITVISPPPRSSLLISTWLPHVHGFPSPHDCSPVHPFLPPLPVVCQSVFFSM